MWFGIVSLFPNLFDAMRHGILGRAIDQGIISLQFFNPRDFTKDPHRTVDDRPFGGGPGMVMKPGPAWDAIEAAKKVAPAETKVVYLSPQGRRFDQQLSKTVSKRPGIIFLAGRYEGIDQRVIDSAVDEEWSLGDFVLSGGEMAAMVMIDCITRLLPGSLGDADSANQDSFMEGLLDYPHYTRPEIFNNVAVPKVLLSGNHSAIRAWRQEQALGNTWLKRPDLLVNYPITTAEQVLLKKFIETSGEKNDEHD